MSDYSLRRADFGPFPLPLRALPGQRARPALLQTPEERQYREMQLAFHASGGLAGSDELTRLLGKHTDQPVSRLARWIVAREVVSLDWQSCTMLPLFQFELPTMTLRPEVTPVLDELAPVLTEWELALWFARPNGWLGGAAPVDAVIAAPGAVLDAARADRFLARG